MTILLDNYVPCMDWYSRLVGGNIEATPKPSTVLTLAPSACIQDISFLMICRAEKGRAEVIGTLFPTSTSIGRVLAANLPHSLQLKDIFPLHECLRLLSAVDDLLDLYRRGADTRQPKY